MFDKKDKKGKKINDISEERKKKNKQETYKLRKEMAEELDEAQALPNSKKLNHLVIYSLLTTKDKIPLSPT